MRSLFFESIAIESLGGDFRMGNDAGLSQQIILGACRFSMGGWKSTRFGNSGVILISGGEAR